MKLIIDIPEENVNEIKDNAMFAGSIPSEILWDVTSAIVNGTPLDKIRAEIDENIYHYEHFLSSNTANGLMIAKKIIDKYKAKSME